MYHPAAALHQPSLKAAVEADFAALPDLIKEAAKIPEHVEQTIQKTEEEPKQLSLF
jgi:DNA polymerase